MQWHDHPCVWKAMAQATGLKGEPSECVTELVRALSQTNVDRVAYYNTVAHYGSEVRWTKERRPFYDVYPSVTEAFVNIDLSKITPSQMALPLKDLMIRFPVGHEFQASKTMKVRSILVSENVAQDNPNTRAILLSINDGTTEMFRYTAIPIHTIRGIVLGNECSIEEHLSNGHIGNDPVDGEAVASVTRLVVALSLLKDNPDLIEQEPLEADRIKWEATHDPKYIEKAERRGTRRWSVGKHIETAPGFRRPHFAIRWCGKGRIDPRLRPIKGCLVRRQQVEEIPTGYLDELLSPSGE